MARIDTTISPDLKTCVEDLAAEHGLSAAAWVRQLIERELLRAHPELSPTYSSVPLRTDEPIERFTVGLTSSENSALAHRARLLGCSKSRWLVCGIRTLLTGEAQPSTVEIDELKASNYRLLSIARDINRVARTLETGVVAQDMSGLCGMFLHLKAHTQSVERVMKASVERWTIR